MVSASQFGQFLKQLVKNKFDAGPSIKSAAYVFGVRVKHAQNPAPNNGTFSLGTNGNSFAPRMTASGGGFSNPNNWSQLPTSGNTAATIASSPSGPPAPKIPRPDKNGFGFHFNHYFNKFYNPWSQEWNLPTSDTTEEALKWVGRGAMGVGALAGTTAAALGVAPALGLGGAGVAGASSSAGTGTAGTVAGGVAAASQTPAGQNTFQRGVQMLGNMSSRVGDLTFRAHDLGNRMWDKIPGSFKHFHESLEHTPVSQALNPTTGVSKAMNPAFTSGDPRGLLPHSVTLPVEAAHHVMHNMGGHGTHNLTSNAGAVH